MPLPEGEVEAEESKSAEPPERPTPSPRPKPGLKTSDGGPDPKGPEKPFAIFTLLDGVSSPAGLVDTDQLAKHLAAVHQFLLCETSFADRRRYASCPSDSRASLHRKLEAQSLDVPASAEGAGGFRLMDDQVEALNLAGVVFNFFLPSSGGIPTAAKFWGAVRDPIPVRSNPLPLPAPSTPLPPTQVES